MLELRIDSDTVSCEDLFLVQNNSLLVINKVNFYNFVGLFYDISEKDSRVSITLGNKKLDNKNICLINLIDIASIYDQLKFKKGSLLYEYIVDEINQSIKDKVEEITEYLDDLFYRNIKRSLFEYDVNFAIDIQKLFLTFSNLDLEISLPEYIKKIDKLLNHLIERNPNKLYNLDYKIEIDPDTVYKSDAVKEFVQALKK